MTRMESLLPACRGAAECCEIFLLVAATGHREAVLALEIEVHHSC